MEPRRLLRVGLVWLPVAIVLAVVAAAAVYVAVSGRAKQYESVARVMVGTPPNPSADDLVVAQELAKEYVRLAPKVAEAVIAAGGYDSSVQSLLRHVKLEAEGGTPIVDVTAVDGDPAEAKRLAQVVSAALIDQVQVEGQSDLGQVIDDYLAAIRDEIQRGQDALTVLVALPYRTPEQESRIDSYLERMSRLRGTYASLLPYSSVLGSQRLELLEPASDPGSPVEPRPTLYAMLVGAVVLMLVFALAAVLAFLDTRIRGRRSLEAAFEAPVLGEVIEVSGSVGKGGRERVIVLSHPQSEHAEAYRLLRARLDVLDRTGAARSVLVMGITPDARSGVVAANLAVAFAESGRRVILVEGDVRGRPLHTCLELDENRGLAALLQDPKATVASVSQPTAHPKLRFVSVGSKPPGAPEVLSSAATAAALTRFEAECDLVVVHGPALLGSPDGTVLSSAIGSVVPVIIGDSIRRPEVTAIREALAMAGAEVRGLVLFRSKRGRLPVDPAYAAKVAREDAGASRPSRT